LIAALIIGWGRFRGDGELRGAIASKPAPTGVWRSTSTRCKLALLGQCATLEFNDALTVVLNRLGGQYAALVVLQLAVQLL